MGDAHARQAITRIKENIRSLSQRGSYIILPFSGSIKKYPTISKIRRDRLINISHLTTTINFPIAFSCILTTLSSNYVSLGNYPIWLFRIKEDIKKPIVETAPVTLNTKNNPSAYNCLELIPFAMLSTQPTVNDIYQIMHTPSIDFRITIQSFLFLVRPRSISSNFLRFAYCKIRNSLLLCLTDCFCD